MFADDVQWRSSEGSASRNRERVVRDLGLVELQGLLVRGEEFSQALEACVFECPLGVHCSPLDVLPDRDIRAKVRLAERLGIPFSVWMKNKNDVGRIEYCLLSMNDGDPAIEKRGVVSEEEFLRWWKRNKTTDQRKSFRKSYLKDSYFDSLLARENLLWGGNIDGLLLDGDCRVLAIVEIRCTKVVPINKYDPARYYREDIGTWKPVIALARKLEVPCFLMTFEADCNEDRLDAVGVATVEDANRKSFVYEGNLPPCENLKRSADEIASYFFQRI